MISTTPPPPYYAVIFTSLLREESPAYEEMAQEMLDLARNQPGFLGYESARKEVGITISYWSSLDAIKAWRNHERHSLARKKGREEWYRNFRVRICRVEREYGV
jgi:heme-degrading monooxygenase HmoA